MSVDVLPLLPWAKGIARGVRADFKFGRRSQEEADLEGVALLALCEKAAAFDPRRVPEGGDPVGAFKGYASRAIRSKCIEEARRLRNAGTYHTRREKGKAPVEAIQASRMRAPDGGSFDVADDGGDGEPE